MKNDNSIKFWFNWYTVEYKKHFINVNALAYKNASIDNEYKLEIKKQLIERQNNYNNRLDKTSDNPINKESITGQLNQIEALKMILNNQEVTIL